MAALAAIEARVNEGFEALAAAAKVEPGDYVALTATLTLIFHALSGIHEVVQIVVEENGHGS